MHNNFNVGDKVEIINDGHPAYSEGDVVTIDSLGGNGVVTSDGYYVSGERIRPYEDPSSEFKAGDKVYVDYPAFFESGRVYTIKAVDGDGDAYFEDSKYISNSKRLTHANVSKSSLNLTVGLRGGESMKELTDKFNEFDAHFETASELLAEAREKMDELRGLIANSIVVEPDKPKELTRGEVVQMAKDYVESQIDSDGEVEFDIDGFTSWKSPEFIVNEEKRTVVVLLRGIITRRIYATGKSKASEGDVFNVYIGKAIALARALGEEVPEEFTNGPQPERAEVGMEVASKIDGERYTLTKRAPELDGVLYYGRAFYHDSSMISWIGENQVNIINDSNVDYKGGK